MSAGDPETAAVPDRLMFEDFHEGREFAFGDYLVTEAEIRAFAAEFDPQPFHLDEATALSSPLKGLAASGWHTASLGMRMIFDGFLHRSSSQGSPGIDELNWRAPVRAGDRLQMSARVTSARRSRSRPQMGLVGFAFEMTNQTGTCVMTQANTIMFGCRDEGA
ncbi:MaoC family dehydratase [Lichenihabitans psoromatis]|uniref:MaoC family dehydratase n=2 Tax=Lichenihabitans psoromatis TaxID=2528642 RepID=UPI0010368D95|nr:MaoC family dehydratase [Lichenihabitans psoromatis]